MRWPATAPVISRHWPSRDAPCRRGFTLLEVIIVITITGIIAAVVAVFIQQPVQGYFDTVRRAQLSDSADIALRRMARDVQTALPNTIRSGDANNYFLEFLPVRSGGRYCAAVDCGDAFDITSASDNSFAVLGPGVSVSSGDSIVIFNTGQSGADAYVGGNRRTFSGAAGASVSAISYSIAAGQFPLASPSNRFQVVSTAITYACDAASGVLRRFSGYAIQGSQPTALSGGQLVTASGNVSGAILASDVVCATGAGDLGTGFDVRATDSLLGMRIQLRSSGESVSLYREVHVDNAP